MSVDTASCKPGSSSLKKTGRQNEHLSYSNIFGRGGTNDSLHGLNQAKASQEQVTVKLQDLHCFHQIVFSDDVLHADTGALIFTRRQVIGNLFSGLLCELGYMGEGIEKSKSHPKLMYTYKQAGYPHLTENKEAFSLLFFFSSSFSRLMTSRRLTFNLSALNAPNMVGLSANKRFE